jgi:predicted acetyltransferase
MLELRKMKIYWNNTLVEEYRIRHYLTDALKAGAGYIGYSIKKDFRCKGYGAINPAT